MGYYGRSGGHTKLVLEGETQMGVKGRSHVCRTPQCLLESSQSKCCRDRKPPSCRQLPQEIQRPLLSQAW